MSEKTMLDFAGRAVLEGDPLGLRALDESLAWRPDGSLPDWLDGADSDDDDFVEAPASAMNLSIDARAGTVIEFADAGDPPPEKKPVVMPELPPTVVVASPFHAERPAPSLSAPPSVPAAPRPLTPLEALVPINDILRFIDEPPEPPAAPAPVAAPPEPVAVAATRRTLSFQELIDARLCLLTEVAGQLWAIPFDRVIAVANARDASRVVDLHERFEGKNRRRTGNAVTVDTDAVLLVDRVLGPRSLGWEAVANDSDAPIWEVARTAIANESVGLLDIDALAG